MGLHQNDMNKKIDDLYDDGKIEYLVYGNECRLLDGRRTEGYIEEINIGEGYFRWRITKYEDAGDFWDVDLEDVNHYQFELDSEKASQDNIESMKISIEKFNRHQEILIDKTVRDETEIRILNAMDDVDKWLNNETKKRLTSIDLECEEGNLDVGHILCDYMRENDMLDAEVLTAKQLVLNPNSGEWFKGIMITMAELGLINYYGKIVRRKDTYTGIGTKESREKYVIMRLAFMRKLFELNEIQELTLYRGMAAEKSWRNVKRSIIHMTFSRNVAEEFSDLNLGSRFKTSYIVKMTVPIDKIFMTYIETEKMNERYKEQEALLIGNVDFSL